MRPRCCSLDYCSLPQHQLSSSWRLSRFSLSLRSPISPPAQLWQSGGRSGPERRDHETALLLLTEAGFALDCPGERQTLAPLQPNNTGLCSFSLLVHHSLSLSLSPCLLPNLRVRLSLSPSLHRSLALPPRPRQRPRIKEHTRPTSGNTGRSMGCTLSRLSV